MEFSIEKYAMPIIKKCGKKGNGRNITIKTEKTSECSERIKIASTWEYCKRTPENKQRLKKE